MVFCLTGCGTVATEMAGVCFQEGCVLVGTGGRGKRAEVSAVSHQH